MIYKTFIAFLSTACCLLSCHHGDELGPEATNNAITFSGYVVKTKGTVVDNVSSLSSMGVVAFYTGSDNFASAASPQLFMDNVLVEKNNNVWKPTNQIYYWPSEGKKVSFFAYSPHSSVFKSGEGVTVAPGTGAATPTLTYKVPALVADQQDLMLAQSPDRTSADGVVKTDLKHALSAIDIKAKVGVPIEQGSSIYLSSLRITGVCGSAIVSISDNVVWSGHSDTTSYALSTALGLKSAALTTTSERVNADNYTLMVLPQTVPQDAKLELEFEVRQNNDGTVIRTVAKSLQMTEVLKTLDVSRIYTLILTYGAEVTVECQVLDWKPGDDTSFDDDGSYTLSVSNREIVYMEDGVEELTVYTDYPGEWSIFSTNQGITISENVDGSNGTTSYKKTKTGETLLYINNATGSASSTSTLTLKAGKIIIPISVADYDLIAQPNCYILNPPTSGDMQYEIPISNALLFWDDKNNFDITNAEKDSCLLSATGNDPWTVGLIWQDQRGIVVPGDIPVSHGITIVQNSGLNGGQNGDRNSYFKINVPSGAKKGNFVVALVKGNKSPVWTNQEVTHLSDKEYRILWSWHFWVTDYNPSGTKSEIAYYNDGANAIPWAWSVPGGTVYRLKDGTVNPSGTANNFVLWSSRYPSSFLMDRQVGVVDIATGEGMMCYQHGRKDPFPLQNVPLYDLSGNAVPYSNNANAIASPLTQTISWTVLNPLKFLDTSGADVGWVSTTSLNRAIWNDPNAKNPTATQKAVRSLFEPTPDGFIVSELDTWSYAYSQYGLSTSNIVSSSSGINKLRMINTDDSYDNDWSTAQTLRGFGNRSRVGIRSYTNSMLHFTRTNHSSGNNARIFNDFTNVGTQPKAAAYPVMPISILK